LDPLSRLKPRKSSVPSPPFSIPPKATSPSRRCFTAAAAPLLPALSPARGPRTPHSRPTDSPGERAGLCWFIALTGPSVGVPKALTENSHGPEPGGCLRDGGSGRVPRPLPGRQQLRLPRASLCPQAGQRRETRTPSHICD